MTWCVVAWLVLAFYGMCLVDIKVLILLADSGDRRLLGEIVGCWLCSSAGLVGCLQRSLAVGVARLMLALLVGC